MKTWAAIAVGCTSVALATSARADERPLFWLEARPWTCVDLLPSLARELALACDAVGGACGIAQTEQAATRRLVVNCDGELLRLDARDPKGTSLWSVDVDGPAPDRLRSAAIFAVRAETSDAPHRHDEPPRPVPATPAPRAPLGVTVAAPPPSDADAREPSEWPGAKTAVVATSFAVGAVGLGVGVLASLKASALTDELQACKPRCTESAIDEAQKFATIGNVGLVVGGAGLLTGLASALFWPNTASSKAGSGQAVRVVASPAWTGVAGTF